MEKELKEKFEQILADALENSPILESIAGVTFNQALSQIVSK